MLRIDRDAKKFTRLQKPEMSTCFPSAEVAQNKEFGSRRRLSHLLHAGNDLKTAILAPYSGLCPWKGAKSNGKIEERN